MTKKPTRIASLAEHEKLAKQLLRGAVRYAQACVDLAAAGTAEPLHDLLSLGEAPEENEDEAKRPN